MKKPGLKSNKDGPVYSTGQGRMCPACGRPKDSCVCRKKAVNSDGDGIVRVGRETKGRKGKGVTIITGIMLDQEGLRKLAGRLKQMCGSGGTVKGGTIEIQGDHREALTGELRRQGWTVKKMGG